MASTISSIILSAIAIFMSISGENKNSYIQNRILETTDEMSDVVEQIQELENNVSVVLNEKLNKLSDIKDELTGVKENVNSAKDKLDELLKVKAYDAVSKDKDIVSENQRLSDELVVEIYKNLNFPKAGIKLVSQVLEYILVVFLGEEGKQQVSSEEAYMYMKEYIYSNLDIASFNMLWGIVRMFSCLGVNKEKEDLCKKILSEVYGVLGNERKEEILAFRDKYIKENSK